MEPFPKIVLVGAGELSNSSPFFRVEVVQQLLECAVPELFSHIASPTIEDCEELNEKLDSLFPLVKTVIEGGTCTFYMVNRACIDNFKFFFDIFVRWLIPGKRLNAVGYHTIDFQLPELNHERYTLCELVVYVDKAVDIQRIKRNLPLIETEARLGLKSSYDARRILEVKGIPYDEKVIFVQEDMQRLTERNGELFSKDLFAEMQHILVLCSEAFKSGHNTRHLSRIVGSQYLFRKRLLLRGQSEPDKRHLLLRFFPIVAKEVGRGQVLAVIIGLNFLRDKEVFEEQHLIAAIRNHLSDVHAVPETFFSNRKASEKVATVYLEIKHGDERPFTRSEIALLKRELAADIKDRIGHLMHPVFMPHNEEEIMRNILALSSEVRYLRDIPQVCITFDEQSEHRLRFLAILVRVLSPGALSIQETFKRGDSAFEYIHDRCKMMGLVRKKHAKEATVFRLEIDSRPFIRQDNCIDLSRARQALLEELTRLIGEVRDYNGGMISKQHELLGAVREQLAENQVKYSELLLDNFFYSLTPVVMRTVLEPQALTTLFTMLLDVVKKEGRFYDQEFPPIESIVKGRYVFAIVFAKNDELRKKLARALRTLQLHSASLASVCTQIYGVPCLGYIYCADDPSDQQQFIDTLCATTASSQQPVLDSVVMR